MALKLITPPETEPVTLAEARLHLKIDDDLTADDDLIASLIVAAREGAEHETRRALLPQTWELALDGFHQDGNRAGQHAYRIVLPKAPLLSITSIRYTDPSGTEQTVPEGAWMVDGYSEPGRLMPPYGDCWPTTRSQPNAVVIRFQAGYPDADAVPKAIKQWMLMKMASMYGNRESFVNGTISQELAGGFVDRLLDPFRIWGL